MNSGPDVLAPEPPVRGAQEHGKVWKLQQRAAGHVGRGHAVGEEVVPRVQVVRREPVADRPERVDRVEDRRVVGREAGAFAFPERIVRLRPKSPRPFHWRCMNVRSYPLDHARDIRLP